MIPRDWSDLASLWMSTFVQFQALFAQVPKDAVDVNWTWAKGIGQAILSEWALLPGIGRQTN